jgi:hypothetical protein
MSSSTTTAKPTTPVAKGRRWARPEACRRDHSAAHVFLSYSRQDFSLVHDLYSVLGDGLAVHPWLDLVELRGGRDWAAQIRLAIESAACFVLVVSRDSTRSNQVEKEWRHALQCGVPIVLVRIDAAGPPPELLDCPSYDVRRRFVATTRILCEHLRIGQHAGFSTRCAALPPLAVLGVMTGYMGLAAWFGYLTTIAWTATIGDAFPVRMGRLADFAFHFTELGVRCVAVATIVAVAVQVYSTACVLRRRIRPLQLLVGLTTTVALVAVSDLFLIAVQDRPHTAVPFPAPGLWPHLLTQDALIVVALATAALVWRHPDLGRRTSLGSTRRSEHFAGNLDDLSLVRRDAIEGWMGRVLPGWTADRHVQNAGAVRVTCDIGSDDLARTLEAFCRCLGFSIVDHDDVAVDHRIVLVPRIDPPPFASGVRLEKAQVVLVLVDSMTISADAEELRRAQWVDFRRLDVRAFRDLARTLLPFAPPSRVIPSPVAPAHFVTPRSITTVLLALIGQSTLSVQWGIAFLATPPAQLMPWILSAAVLASSIVLNTLMTVALATGLWTPRAFGLGAAAAWIASVLANLGLLHGSSWSPPAFVLVALLSAIQLMTYAGCLIVTRSMWMSRGTAGRRLALPSEALLPAAAAAFFVLVTTSPVLLGIGPLAGR